VLGLAATEPENDDRIFGDYELIEEIARGGMGVIYRARQRSVDRTVAIKMIRGDALQSSSARMRFQVEAGAIASLEHPHIVSLFESGEHEEQLFYSMRFVSGGTFLDRLRATDFQTHDHVRLLSKVARAVQYAHTNGVLHRDLKPSNILIDEKGEPQLVDFGLAKMTEQDLDLTRTETVMGSPNYMAPEQASQAESVTTAADVYSLGAILYEILCGRPPFQAETALETMRRVVDEDPTPPNRVRPTNRDLEVVCLKCLEKKSGNRYRSAAALADELDRWLDGEPVRARPISAPVRLTRWAQRQPALAGALAATGILLVSVAVISTTAYLRGQEANRLIGIEKDRTARQLYLAQLRETDDLFEKGNTSDAMALISKLGRDWPQDEVLWRRMANVLQYQSIPRLEAPYIHLGKGQILDWAPSGEAMLQVVTEAGAILHLDQSQGTVSKVVYQSDLPVELADISSGSLDVALVYQDGTLKVIPSMENRRELSLASDSQVTHLAISSDGTRVATVEDWRNLVFRDTRTGNRVGRQIFLPNAVAVIEFGDRGHSLAVGLSQGGGLLCDGMSGELLRHFEDAHHSYHDVEVSADQRVIAFASPGGPIAVWDLNSGQRLDHGQFHHLTRANGIRLSPNGRRAVSFDASGKAKIWKLDSMEPGPELSHIDYVSHAAFSSDGKKVVTASHDRMVRVWDVETGRALTSAMAHSSGLQRVSFGESDETVCALCYDGTVWKWQVSGAPLSPVKTRGGDYSQSAAFAPGSGIVGVGVRAESGQWRLDLIRPDTGVVELTVPVQDTVGMLTMDPSSRRLAYRLGDTVEVREVATGERVCDPIEFPFGGIGELAFSSQGDRLAVASVWTPAKIISLDESGPSVIELGVQNLRMIRFSPDGEFVATSSDEGVCQLWDAGTGEEVGEIAQNGSARAFSSDGRFVAIVQGERAYLVDREINHWLQGQIQHDSQIQEFVFSQDDRWVATASRDETVQVWEVDSEQIRFVTRLWHHSAVNAVQFDPQGRFLATGTEDAKVRLWDLKTGHPITEWLHHDGAIREIFFDPGGGWFCVVTGTGSTSTWPIRNPLQSDMPWLPDLLEYLARHQVNEQGRAISLEMGEISARENRLREVFRKNSQSPILTRFLSQVRPDTSVNP
jgi:eukaryotic-like serine/threonine-protein kinase